MNRLKVIKKHKTLAVTIPIAHQKLPEKIYLIAALNIFLIIRS